jgi:RNA-directed DNA polymerase
MYTPEQLRILSKTEKARIWKCLSRESYPRGKTLQKLTRHELNALLLLSLETPIELCRFTGRGLPEIEDIINNPEYKQFNVEKKRGGTREICEPASILKKIQKRLNYFLQAYYLCIKPETVHGFVVNPHYLGHSCNIAENAKVHTGKKHVANIDLKDFFSSIAAWRVKDIFTSEIFGYNDQLATALTLLTTFEGKLPTGAPSSPVLSNFICLELDRELAEFCTANGFTYSRYADDMSFSADRLISDNELLDIISIINQNGFRINEKKLRLKKANQKQTVTGLTVNEKVNVNRKLLKKTRAMLHDLSRNGVNAATKKHFGIEGDVQAALLIRFINRLEGYINFIGQVRGKKHPLYLKIKNSFDSIYQLRSRLNYASKCRI